MARIASEDIGHPLFASSSREILKSKIHALIKDSIISHDSFKLENYQDYATWVDYENSSTLVHDELWIIEKLEFIDE